LAQNESNQRCEKIKQAIISAPVWLEITADIANHEHHEPIAPNRP
jgi:hypothetical protein